MKLRSTYNFFNKVFLLVAFSLILLNANAQDTKANAVLDSNTIQIGQQVKLTLSIQYRVDKGKQVKVNWPEMSQP